MAQPRVLSIVGLEGCPLCIVAGAEPCPDLKAGNKESKVRQRQARGQELRVVLERQGYEAWALLEPCEVPTD